MSATLVSSNTTIKVNGGSSSSVISGSVNITAAANEYIILNMQSTGTTCTYSIGGLNKPFVGAAEIYTLYIPSGATCTLTAPIGNSVAYNFVRFINTP